MLISFRNWTLAFILLTALFISHKAMAFSPGPAQPLKVVFYPDEIEITVEEKLAPEELPSGGNGFLLALPAKAKSDSLLISINGTSAGGYFWLDPEQIERVASRSSQAPGKGTLPENEPSPERRALLERLILLDTEVAEKRGALTAAASRITLWEKSLALFGESSDSPILSSPSPADEALKLNDAYAQQIPALYLERDKQQRALDDAVLRRDKARKTLHDFDHREGMSVAAVPLAAPLATRGETLLRYSYVMPGSCTLSYRLGAYPDKGEVVIDQDAVLTQNSGFVWTEADVYISTLRRDRTLQPRNIQPWRISLIDKIQPLAASAENSYLTRQRIQQEVPMSAPMQASVEGNFETMGKSQEEALSAPDSHMAPPTAEERGTFRMWSLGKRRIENNTPVILALATDSHEASFLYTVRPVNNPKGFLTASLSLSKALELPPGPAQFTVDGAAIGSRAFSFNGNKGEIYFGTDPRVTATMRNMQKSGGEQGFFSKEQTLLWHWQITLHNARTKAVDIVLEDPAPVAQDTSIAIKTTSTPKPESLVKSPEHGGAAVYRWKTGLQPGETKIIEHTVEISAPANKDKALDPGFRRR